ncbi:peptidoglycan-binding domain-containing protein [Cognatilysobacter terrigena]|uniref:peptidoglycan-binding domain-containing protein n=1 Tax=Cognatilysobacter terrigena TaxID=2488749 RepID=UPI001415211C|nr:peptidoglycan-binding domain-containing protein [Lysobacter terrigena]
MGRYRLIESAEHGIERVHGYADLEIHHPSHHGHQPGRHYATVDGRREEVLKAPTSAGHLMVSKDFILTDEAGSTRVPVPSPAAGYVGKVDARNGLVCIYDRKGGELIAQVRHMDLHGSGVHEGQTVAYGQPLGFQGGYGGGNPHAYGVHTHIDFNTARLDDFKRYFADLDRGVITIGGVPHVRATPQMQTLPTSGGEVAHSQAHRGAHAPGTATDVAAVRRAQSALAHLGYTGEDGHVVRVDGVVGANSRHALREFQRNHGLVVTGALDAQTAQRLSEAERTMASSTHPAHELYGQSLSAVQELDRRMGIPGGPHTLALAGARAAEAARAGLKHIDRVEIGRDRVQVQAVQFARGVDDAATNRISAPINVAIAVNQSLEESSRQAARAIESHGRTAEQLAHQHAPMRSSVM